ncbi:PAS-domain containing protein [Primorskyibacter marinus]|uniref:PAS-domain containing protein n=1 Tax=Primorskyibacter marinus TaxID=1977320 RepID=UPI000E307D4E|nr:PAS-domain containing protein [Primorskyibacter marinus]
MQKSVAMTRAGLNLIQQALTIYDSDLRLVVCNRRFQEMFNLPQALCTIGAEFEDTVRHLVMCGEYGEVDDAAGFVRIRVEQALAFEPHYMERTRANGRVISVEGAPLPQGGWVTVYTDITQTRRQEELLRTHSEHLSDQVLARSEELSAMNRKLAATVTALEEAKRELTEMEARTRLVTEMMPAHIAHLDADGRYTYSNRRLSTVIPGRPSEILGLHISDTLGPEAFATVEPYLTAALEGQQSTFEFTDIRSSRRIRAAFNPDQSDNGVYILSMDVTEETQARAALQQTRKRELGAQLTSGLAHDFSNLLTIILGMQSRLQRLDLPETAEPLITGTVQAARRGGALLHRIADMTGHRAFSPEPTCMPQFLRDLQTLVTPSLSDGLSLAVDNAFSGALLLDPGMLQDSILNLILNARDACGGTGQITLHAHPHMDTWAEFIVSDTGPGFSDQALTHALDPFFSTKGGEGMGLGLAMVYDMTKLAGGEVRLGNSDTGARVTLRLPLRRAETTPAPGLVLLVEDSPDLRADVREMLTDMGHAVVEAASVAEAVLLAKGLPDIALVLSDVSLEGPETGLALLDLLPDHRVSLMTSLPTDNPLHREALDRVPVLAKPFTQAQLMGFLMLQRSAA